MVLNWAGNDIELFSTPGHSPGSVCITFNRKLFTGDSLLEKGPMNRFPGGSKSDYLLKTLPFLKRQIKKVDIIFPGHGKEYSSRDVMFAI